MEKATEAALKTVLARSGDKKAARAGGGYAMMAALACQKALLFGWH